MDLMLSNSEFDILCLVVIVIIGGPEKNYFV